MKSRNQREGRFTGHSARGYPKNKYNREDTKILATRYVHHRYRLKAAPQWSIEGIMDHAHRMVAAFGVDLSVLMPEASAAPTSEAEMRAYHERQWIGMSRPKTRDEIFSDFMSVINERKKDFGL